MKSRFGKVCLAGVLASCALAAFLVWHGRTPPQVGEPVLFSQLPRAEQQKRRAEVRQLEAQVQDLAKAAKHKEQRPFTLTITERQLNTLMQDRLGSGKFPIHDPRVGLDTDRLSLQGRVEYGGLNAVATLRGSVEAKDGDLRYQADSLEVSGLPMRSMKGKAEKQVTRALNRLLKEAPGRVQRVRVEDNSITVQGVTD